MKFLGLRRHYPRSHYPVLIWDMHLQKEDTNRTCVISLHIILLPSVCNATRIVNEVLRLKKTLPWISLPSPIGHAFAQRGHKQDLCNFTASVCNAIVQVIGSRSLQAWIFPIWLHKLMISMQNYLSYITISNSAVQIRKWIFQEHYDYIM